MPFCSIMTCKNDSRNVNLTHGGITYHRFPQDPELRNTWTEATGRVNWKPKQGSTICSIHFEDKYFLVKEKLKKRLSTHAVPTLNVLSFHPEMHVVTFENVHEPLRSECQPHLVNVLYEQGMKDGNVSLMVPVKTPNDENDDDEDEGDENDDEQKLTPRERKLKAKLRWTRDEIKRQKRTIKKHEMRIYRLRLKRLESKKFIDILQDNFGMPIEDIVKINLKNCM